MIAVHKILIIVRKYRITDQETQTRDVSKKANSQVEYGTDPRVGLLNKKKIKKTKKAL